MSDKTNPDHYFTSTGVELIEVTEDMNFCLGNCMKYIFRAGRKDGEGKLDDLEKAMWYLQREIDKETHSEQRQPASQNYRHLP